MSAITIAKVTDKKGLKAFIDYPHDLYKNDPNYVPELFIAQSDIMNPKKNPFFQHGDIQQFLAYQEGKIVGRIAAIYNGNYIKYTGKNDGFFGFFDCINDQEVADALIQSTENWLKEKKITQNIIGPVNPTTNDTCGLLIEGFNEAPMAMMPYNFSYYQQLLEHNQYKKQTDLLAYIYEGQEYQADRIKRLQTALKERLQKRGITIRPMDFSKKNFQSEFQKVQTVYNKAWDKNLGFVPLTDAEFAHMAKDLKLVITDPRLCMVAEAGDKFVGWALMLPNVNEIQKRIPRGRLFPFGLFKLLTGMKKVNSYRILTLGVIDEYRKLGIESLFYGSFIDFKEEHKNIQRVEASWILEDNVLMNKGIQDINGKVYKKYRIFEKQI